QHPTGRTPYSLRTANRSLAGTRPPPSASGSRASCDSGSFVILQFVEQVELSGDLRLIPAPRAPSERADGAVIAHRSERRIGRRGPGAPRVRLLLWWAGVVTRHNANLPSRHTNSRPRLAVLLVLTRTNRASHQHAGTLHD